MQMNKKTKIIVLSAIAVVIIALIVVLAIVLGGKKETDGSSSNSTAAVVSIDEAEYNQKVAVMTPTDAASIVGKWMLTGIQTAEGGAADAVAVIGREILTSDIMTFQADGSFSNYIGGFENKNVEDLTGLYTVSESGISLTYGNGKTASASFDSVKQILTVNDGTYTYTLLRVF